MTASIVHKTLSENVYLLGAGIRCFVTSIQIQCCSVLLCWCVKFSLLTDNLTWYLRGTWRTAYVELSAVWGQVLYFYGKEAVISRLAWKQSTCYLKFSSMEYSLSTPIARFASRRCVQHLINISKLFLVCLVIGFVDRCIWLLKV